MKSAANPDHTDPREFTASLVKTKTVTIEPKIAKVTELKLKENGQEASYMVVFEAGSLASRVRKVVNFEL